MREMCVSLALLPPIPAPVPVSAPVAVSASVSASAATIAAAAAVAPRPTFGRSGTLFLAAISISTSSATVAAAAFARSVACPGSRGAEVRGHMLREQSLAVSLICDGAEACAAAEFLAHDLPACAGADLQARCFPTVCFRIIRNLETMHD